MNLPRGFSVPGALLAIGFIGGRRIAVEMGTVYSIWPATGWLHRRTFELPLSRLESIRVEQSIPARVLGFGTVMVAGVGGGRQVFTHMAWPLAFRRAAEEVLYKRSP